MPRINRAIAIGFPHHVVHRGNNKENIFIDWKDYEEYLILLKKYSENFKSLILAYCLMSNHIHLLIKPTDDGSLAKMMQGVSMRYAQHINRKYKKTGRLWEQRYFSSIVGCERYLWIVVRYIEQYPLRAGIVEHEVDYPYSSARAHIDGALDTLLSENIFDQNERKEYVKFVAETVNQEEIEKLRYSIRKGSPFGNEKFLIEMEKQFKQSFRARPVGRPVNQNQILIGECP